MLGWAIGNIAGKDSRLRRYCTLGAVLPDVDGVGFFFSPTAYDTYHHTYGHNLYTGVLFAVFVAWRCRSWFAFMLAGASFGSHLLTDIYLSAWPVFLFWPTSGHGYVSAHSLPLSHPLNIQLIYVGYVVVVLLTVLCKRTPIELISPRIDRLVTTVFSRRRWRCGQCDGRANLRCNGCGKPVCLRHGVIMKGLRLVCAECARSNAPPFGQERAET